MTIARLTPAECDIVRQTSQAVFRFLDVDFHTRLGIARKTMEKLPARWPNVDDSSGLSDACVAINNSFNGLLNGIGIADA